MTALTFGVLVLLTAIAVAALFGSVQAARAARNRRPGGGASFIACLAVVLAAGALIGWQVLHYFDIQDGIRNHPIGPFRPYLIMSGALLVCATGSAVVALVQLVLSRRRVTAESGAPSAER